MKTHTTNLFRLAAEVLTQAKKVLVLTGAGISIDAPANIPSFTGDDAIHEFEGVPIMEVATRNSPLMTKYYEMRRQLAIKAEPTTAHKILASWEQRFPDFLLVTQNTDNLHIRAGSKKIIEIHGNLFDPAASSSSPNIVMFGEEVSAKLINEALTYALDSNVVVMIGTSNLVEPVGLLPYAAQGFNNAALININIESGISSAIPLVGRANDMLEKLEIELDKICSLSDAK